MPPPFERIPTQRHNKIKITTFVLAMTFMIAFLFASHKALGASTSFDRNSDDAVNVIIVTFGLGLLGLIGLSIGMFMLIWRNSGVKMITFSAILALPTIILLLIELRNRFDNDLSHLLLAIALIIAALGTYGLVTSTLNLIKKKSMLKRFLVSTLFILSAASIAIATLSPAIISINQLKINSSNK